MTGPVEVTVTAPEGTRAVAFEVSLDGGASWMHIATDADARDGWSGVWDSGDYSGAAVLRVTADDRSRAEVQVRVDNQPPVLQLDIVDPHISPNGDGTKDTALLTLTANEPAELRLVVIDAHNAELARWTARGTALVARWKARIYGVPVPDGVYEVEVTAVDDAGLTTVTSGTVRVDTVAPRLRVPPLRDKVARGPRPKVFRYSTTEGGRVDLELRAWSRTELLRRTRQTDRLPQGVIRFHPRYRGGRLLDPGRYRVRISVTDAAGNSALSRPRYVIVHHGVRARVVNRVQNAGRRVALTFDDCNFADAWRRLLDGLRRARAKATFFCPGSLVRRYPALARRTVRAGHAIGAHGWDHALLSGRSLASSLWRLTADRKAWLSVTGDTPAPLFRPPFGAMDGNVLQAAGRAGFRHVVMWDIDPFDWATSSPSVIAGRVLRSVRPGSIVVLHVKMPTALALPEILRGLARKDLEPVDLHTLLAYRS